MTFLSRWQLLYVKIIRNLLTSCGSLFLMHRSSCRDIYIDGMPIKLSPSAYIVNVIHAFLGDSLTNHLGMKFSTYDSQHNSCSTNCAVEYRGAWWYTCCHSSNLNGFYYLGYHSSYADGIEWNAWTGYHYSLKTTEMKIRPFSYWRQLNAIRSSYVKCCCREMVNQVKQWWKKNKQLQHRLICILTNCLYCLKRTLS